MPTTICLVRHGETDWNAAGRIQGQEDTLLNDAGRQQAQRAGDHLQQWPWDVLVTSPLARARDTARIIGTAIGLELTDQMAALMERDYGAASGLTPDAMHAQFPDRAIPGLETHDALRTRIMHGLDTLVQRYPNRRIIAVAHGGIINAALARLSDGAIGSGKTRLGNACLNQLRHTPAGWEIEFYNYQEHLTGDRPTGAAAFVSVE